MENIQYAEELLREFLVFRGFTSTLQAFEKELSTDIGRNFQVDKILDLVFSVYIPKYQADKLIALLNFFKRCFSSSSETVFISTLTKLEMSILQYYIIHALQSGRHDKVVEFFQANTNFLLQKREDWMPWFGRFLYFCNLEFLNHALTFDFKDIAIQLFRILQTLAWILSFECTIQKNGLMLCFYHSRTS